VRTKASAGQIEIEFAQVPSLSSSYTVTWQLKLTSAGTIEVRYGAITGTSGSTATVGFENSTGTAGAAYLGCSTSTSNCAHANWPTNSLFVIGQPVQPDIAVPTVNISNLVNTAGQISVTVTPTFQNFGQNATPAPFAWKAYLSTDTTLQPLTDILIYTSAADVTLAGAGTAGAIATPSGSAMSPGVVPAANYYVLVEADWSNVVTEALETNNVGRTNTFFINGLDLVATSVSGPANSGPGNPIVVNVKWQNQGSAAPTGPVAVRVLLSTDTVASTNDFQLYNGTRTVTGGETVDENLNITVPGNVLPGDLHYILQLDPLSAIAETNEGNNTAVSAAKVNITQADLVAVTTDLMDPITGGPTRLGYFGQPARVNVRMDNIGGANAANFHAAVVISTDATLSLLSDTIAVEQLIPLVAQAGTLTLDLPFTLPLNDRSGAPFVSGNYFVFVVLDSRSQVTELNEQNNHLAIMGTVSLRAPAADLTVTRVEAPASGAVGELFPVLRTLKNIGNVNAPPVKYRYYASANAIITSDDVPLVIKSGATEVTEGSVTLGVGADDTQTELVRLPAGMPAGTYYLGVIIDGDGAVPELEEGNNALASATVQVAASSLRVSTQQLPDAMVQRPFVYRLVALGELGAPSTWAIDPSQGALPMGLTLATDGQLSGTPTIAGVAAFTVVISNSGREARARLVLRVLPTSTQVEITTVALRPVVNQATEKYEQPLAAAGGVKPYTWRVVSGTLPPNLTLSADGLISGFPRNSPPLIEGASNVTFEVVDQLGTRATKSLSIRVIAPGSIVFRNLALPDAMVGEDYGTDVVVVNGDGTAIAAMQKPLTWTVQGSLPDGLTIAPSNDLLSIEGKALRAGTFSFTLSVEDAKGRSDTAEFLIRVHASRFQLSSVGKPETVAPGELVSFEIVATSNANPKFQLYAGNLAPGLTMDSNGKVTGMIAPENSEGTWNFVVTARDDNGSTGLGAFGLDVKRAPRVVGCTCGAADVGSGLAWLLAVMVPFGLRRRRA
jgi:subtilase family serine protease